jgi:hypothetical protein
MVTRRNRLNDFITDRDPPPDDLVQVLCEDHVGTYVISFPCQRTDGTWRNQATGEVIAGVVIGWREFGRNRRRKVPALGS